MAQFTAPAGLLVQIAQDTASLQNSVAWVRIIDALAAAGISPKAASALRKSIWTIRQGLPKA
jgi:hypothetical protein